MFGSLHREWIVELAVIGYRLCEPLTGVGRYVQSYNHKLWMSL